MSELRICEIKDIQDQIAPATATGNHYAPAEIVLHKRWVDTNGQWHIEFSLRGDSSQAMHQARWGDTAEMWTPCPSTFPSLVDDDVPGEAPKVGAFGRLYLSQPFLDAHSLSSPLMSPKWPPRMPATDPPARTLAIYPISLELVGYEMRTGQLRRASIDLLAPDQAAQQQTIVLDGTSPVRVELTEASFAKFTLPFVAAND